MPDHEPADLQPAPLEDLFLEASRSIRRRWLAALSPWEIAPQQARTLRAIATHQPIRPGVLADHLRIAARSVTDVVEALAARGYLQRDPDPDDRRATVLTLTELGHEVEQAVHNARQAAAKDYFASLTDPDRAALTRILHELADANDLDRGHGR